MSDRWIWRGGAGRLSPDDYRRSVLGYFGPYLKAISQEYGVPLEELIFDCNRSFAKVAEIRKARERASRVSGRA